MIAPPLPAPRRLGRGPHGDLSGLVALLKEYYGRGPEQTRTYFSDDLVVCLLRGGFTRVEQTLLEGGHGDEVIRQRMAVDGRQRLGARTPASGDRF